LSQGGEWLLSAAVGNGSIAALFRCQNPGSGPFVAYSNDAGETWNENWDDTLNGGDPSILLSSNGVLHMARTKSPPSEMGLDIQYDRSTDLGASWSTKTFLTTEDEYGSMISSMSAWRNRIIVTWREEKYGCYTGWGCSILARISSDCGLTWGDEMVITEIPNGVRSHSVSSRNVIAVAWVAEYDDTSEIHIRMSFDSGKTWAPVDHLGRGGIATLALTRKAVHVFFDDYDSQRVFYRRGVLPLTPLSLPVDVGWQMVSLPIESDTGLVSSIYPTAISQAFSYADGGYASSDTMKIGVGYWVKFPESDTVTVRGVPVLDEVIAVHEGWNMIGSITTPVAVENILTDPPGIIGSRFFTFDAQYVVADTLETGKSYWVKATQGGTITLREQIE
jgi:hypothetical protein